MTLQTTPIPEAKRRTRTAVVLAYKSRVNITNKRNDRIGTDDTVIANRKITSVATDKDDLMLAGVWGQSRVRRTIVQPKITERQTKNNAAEPTAIVS